MNKIRYSVACDYIKPCSVLIDEVDVCPICKKSIKPVFNYGVMYKDNERDLLAILYQCTGCNSFFVTRYSDAQRTSFGPYEFNKLDYVAPNKYLYKPFEPIIEENFNNFANIYKQASEAEYMGLDEIAGMGYRKALEFLIKDFLIKDFPEKKDSIEKTSLSTCIENYVNNENIKSVAKRATWLGNDQVHYKQVYTECDINDLKNLIEITVYWILMDYKTKKSIEAITKKIDC